MKTQTTHTIRLQPRWTDVCARECIHCCDARNWEKNTEWMKESKAEHELRSLLSLFVGWLDDVGCSSRHNVRGSSHSATQWLYFIEGLLMVSRPSLWNAEDSLEPMISPHFYDDNDSCTAVIFINVCRTWYSKYHYKMKLLLFLSITPFSAVCTSTSCTLFNTRLFNSLPFWLLRLLLCHRQDEPFIFKSFLFTLLYNF